MKILRPIRHEKVWGEELWITNTSLYCGKLMKLHKGHACSLHCHKKKTETFCVMYGMVLLWLDGDYYSLADKDTITIHPGIYHSFTGIDDSVFIEISTNHSDTDVSRITESRQLTTEEFVKAVAEYNRGIKSLVEDRIPSSSWIAPQGSTLKP